MKNTLTKNSNKNIVILGSTGSIGKMTLDVLDNLKQYNVLGLSTNTRIDILIEQIKKYKPTAIAITNENSAKLFYSNHQDIIKQYNLTIFSGESGLAKILDLDKIDFVMVSLVGAIGLASISKALKLGYNVAVANKEPIIIAGDILIKEAKKYNNTIFPVDSEHSAIYQCLLGENINEVKKIILTASGGPFYKHTLGQLKNVTINEALKHPKWKMGQKITIDSATLMNKGFEVIEAHYLFNMPLKKIEIIIHPESIIHSMVEFIDGSIKAHLGKTDMRIPIQFAMTYPERKNINDMSLNFNELKKLTFEKPDYEKFKALQIAFDCIKLGQGYPTVLNAANEILVGKFLNGEIKFLDIIEKIMKIIDEYIPEKIETIEDVIYLNSKIRLKYNNI